MKNLINKAAAVLRAKRLERQRIKLVNELSDHLKRDIGLQGYSSSRRHKPVDLSVKKVRARVALTRLLHGP